MRRLDSNTKEIICWVRSSTVQANERLEFFLETKMDVDGGEFAETISDITENLTEGYRETLARAIGLEVLDVLNSFDLPKGHENKKRSAFPHLQDCKEVDFNETIVEYVSDVIDDILDLPSLPAMAIIDELEEWLNDLYDFHMDNQKESE